jgi:glucuronate isomerase
VLLNRNFLLTTAWSERLFHEHAEKMPIIDYHCHLDPRQIYEDRRFDNLAQVWIRDGEGGDHYKWRLMRANGTPERLITGDGDDKDKYLAFVRAIEKAPGNPLFEWSHLELRRVFGIEEPLNQKNAGEIWDRANEIIDEPWFSARGLIKKFDVRCLCTTDDPVSDLAYHKLLAEQEASNGFRVLPTFRSDGLLGIEQEGFADYVRVLSRAADLSIGDLQGLKEAVAQRVDYFHVAGGSSR